MKDLVIYKLTKTTSITIKKDHNKKYHVIFNKNGKDTGGTFNMTTLAEALNAWNVWIRYKN